MWKSQSLTPCHCFPTPFSGLNVFKLWGKKAGWMWGEYEGLLGCSLWALGGGVEGEAMVKHGCLVVWIDPPPWIGPPQANFILHWAAEQKGNRLSFETHVKLPSYRLGIDMVPWGALFGLVVGHEWRGGAGWPDLTESLIWEADTDGTYLGIWVFQRMRCFVIKGRNKKKSQPVVPVSRFSIKPIG